MFLDSRAHVDHWFESGLRRVDPWLDGLVLTVLMATAVDSRGKKNTGRINYVELKPQINL